jgi:hypothetical protein
LCSEGAIECGGAAAVMPARCLAVKAVCPAAHEENKKTGGHPGFYHFGSRSRTRTCGMVVNSHPLYRLSYPGMNIIMLHTPAAQFPILCL